jgi:hypothetical protein
MDSGKPEKKKTAFNVSKLSLSAPNPQVKGVFATLKFDIFQNNPRIIVDTRDPNLLSRENGFGKIEAAMTMTDVYALLVVLERAAHAKEEFKAKIECFGHDWVNGQKSKDITHLSSVWIGRDTDGQIFISVVAENKKQFPIIKFLFGPSDQRYTKWFDAQGTPWTKAKASQVYACAYADMLCSLYASVADTHYWQAPPGQWGNKGGNSGGGGYNRSGGGGGGYNNNYNNRGSGEQQQQRQPAEVTQDEGDDIPF